MTFQKENWSFRFFENDKITKIAKIRTDKLGDETVSFLGLIFIEDLEYDFKNWFIPWKYHKKDLKRKNRISWISTSDWAENWQAERFWPPY